MLAYLVKRLVVALGVAVAVSVIAFLLLRMSGDIAVALAGDGASDADIQAIRIAHGLDRPLIGQYFEWAQQALHGKMGESLHFKLPVATLIADRIGVTLSLGGVSLVFALLLAIPLGMVAALRPNSWVDRLALALAVLGQAMPSFWFALMLILFLGVFWRLLPVSGNEGWQHYIMPALALGYNATPAIMRLTRSGMIEALDMDYIRTARAKGLHMPRILFKHALRNALIPVVALATVQFGFMLGGSIVIESVFSLDGIGHLAWISIQRADFPVVQAVVLIVSLIYILLSLLADLLNGWLDPRLRAG